MQLVTQRVDVVGLQQALQQARLGVHCLARPGCARNKGVHRVRIGALRVRRIVLALQCAPLPMCRERWLMWRPMVFASERWNAIPRCASSRSCVFAPTRAWMSSCSLATSRRRDVYSPSSTRLLLRHPLSLSRALRCLCLCALPQCSLPPKIIFKAFALALLLLMQRLLPKPCLAELLAGCAQVFLQVAQTVLCAVAVCARSLRRLDRISNVIIKYTFPKRCHAF